MFYLESIMLHYYKNSVKKITIEKRIWVKSIFKRFLDTNIYDIYQEYLNWKKSWEFFKIKILMELFESSNCKKFLVCILVIFIKIIFLFYVYVLMSYRASTSIVSFIFGDNFFLGGRDTGIELMTLHIAGKCLSHWANSLALLSLL